MKLHKQIGGSIITESRVVKNSEVIKVGDLVTDKSTGAASPTAITDKLRMIVTGFSDKNGINREDIVSAGGGSFATATRTFTAASDNATVGLVKVVGNLIQEGTQIKATLNKAASATILPGYYVSIAVSTSTGGANAALLDVDTASTTAQQFRIVRVSGPDLSATEVIVEVTSGFRQV